MTSLRPEINPAEAPHCAGAGVYARPDGCRVCLGCAAVWWTDAGWQAQTIRSCAPGLHRWGPRYADDHPRQCLDCPACEARTPAQAALLQAPPYRGTGQARVWAETGPAPARRPGTSRRAR